MVCPRDMTASPHWKHIFWRFRVTQPEGDTPNWLFLLLSLLWLQLSSSCLPLWLFLLLVVGLYHLCFILSHAQHYLTNINHGWFSLLLNPDHSTMVLVAINMIRSWLLMCSQMTNPYQPKILANQVFTPTIKELDQALWLSNMCDQRWIERSNTDVVAVSLWFRTMLIDGFWSTSQFGFVQK